MQKNNKIWFKLIGLAFFLWITAFHIHPSISASELDGWIEIQANVPKGFDRDITVELKHMETGSTITCFLYKGNGYLLHERLLIGFYQAVIHIDNPANGIYPVKQGIQPFQIKKKNAALKVELDVNEFEADASYFEDLEVNETWIEETSIPIQSYEEKAIELDESNTTIKREKKSGMVVILGLTVFLILQIWVYRKQKGKEQSK